MYYVYVHSIPNGSPFYVGKGTGRRAYASSKRPLIWKNIISENNGITIQIVKYFDTEDLAYEYEIKLIKQYRDLGYNLINQSSGGRGPLDYCRSEESRKSMSKKMTGYKHKTVTCPECGATGGETSMKRWHFDNCTGNKSHKARVTINGTRILIGKYGSIEEAKIAEDAYYLASGFTRSGFRVIPRETLSVV
jgi:hypothetical protein